MSSEKPELHPKVREVVESPGWHMLKMYGPAVDEYGHTMEDGTHYPPTFATNIKLAALRSDGTYFQVNLVFNEDEVPAEALRLMAAKFVNGLMTLETFRTCACVAGRTCERHT
jgi:hypothetical protein